MNRYIKKSGTSKQARKYKDYKSNYKNKKEQIINIRELLKNDKRTMAKKCIDSYINENGKDGYVLHELGKYYYAMGEIPSSKECFEEVIENNYKNKYYSMYELSKIEKFYSNYDRAIQLLNNIIHSDHPEKCHAELELAKIYYIIGRLDDTVGTITELILTNAENKVYAFDSLIEISDEVSDPNLIYKFYKLVENDLSDNEKKYYKAFIYKMNKKTDKAIKYFELIADSNGEFSNRSKYQLAIIYFELERFDKTIQLSKEVIDDRDGISPSCFRLLASAYTSIFEYDKAKEYIEKLEVFGGFQDNIVNFLYGILYSNMQEYDKSIEYFKAINTTNKYIYHESLNRLGCVYVKINEFEKSLECFTKLKELDVCKRHDIECITALTYLQKKLKLNYTEDINKYSTKQIINYSKEEAIEHIKKHKEEQKDKIIHSVFSPDIDVEELFDYASNHIGDDNFKYNNLMDVYLLEYPNVGIDKGHNINYLTVVTLPNSKDIITMYPYKSVTEKNNLNKSKVKKMSRIDKFNQKYNM